MGRRRRSQKSREQRQKLSILNPEPEQERAGFEELFVPADLSTLMANPSATKVPRPSENVSQGYPAHKKTSYKGTSPITKQISRTSWPTPPLQGYLAHQKTSLPRGRGSLLPLLGLLGAVLL